MKLISFLEDERDRLGVLINDMVYDMEVLHPDLPNSMGMFLNYWEDAFPVAQARPPCADGARRAIRT